MQEPGALFVMLIVGDTNPRITCYHMVMNGENSRLLEVHPRDLERQMVSLFKME